MSTTIFKKDNAMSSHHEWAEEVTARHDALKPYAPENGQPLRFKVGDPVIYTNPAGIEFPLRITGFYRRPASPDAMYANGARYLLDWECPWFPVRQSCLRPDESRAVQALEAKA